MEPKQILMLSVLLLVALIGSGYIINVLKNLDKEEDSENEPGGHH